MVGKEFPAFPSHLKRRHSPQERRAELEGRATIPRVPQMSQSIPGKPVSLHCLDFQDDDPLTPRWHVGQPFGKALRESHRSIDPRKGNRDTAAAAREESSRACPHSREGLTPLGILQKYSKIHISTGEESSGSGTDSTQGLRPRHRWEMNPKRLPSNSHGDWPFLRPPERVPEFPVLSPSTCRNLRKSRRFSLPGEMRTISAEVS